MNECPEYANRMEWSGNYDYYGCAVTIKDAKPEDAGKWVCELESYVSGYYRGYGYNVTANYDIEILHKKGTYFPKLY